MSGTQTGVDKERGKVTSVIFRVTLADPVVSGSGTETSLVPLLPAVLSEKLGGQR